MKYYFITLILFLPLALIGKAPSNPYYIPTVGFENLIPFSVEELKIIDENDISEVMESDNMYTTYYFSKNLLDSSKSQSKTHENYLQTTVYKYDSNNNLILRKATDSFDSYIGYDSLIYNEKGRIIRYYAYNSYKKNIKRKNSKREKTILCDLYYVDSRDGLYLLVDSADKEFPASYFLDNKNQLTKRVYQISKRVDSLSTNKLLKDTIAKSWYLKQNIDSSFHLGSTSIYYDERIISETDYSIYDENYIAADRQYLYNCKSQLIQIYNRKHDNTDWFFAYNNKGLRREAIYIVGDKLKDYKTFNYN